MAEIAIGIDLGTSNSCVAISRISFVKILPRFASAAPFLRLMVDHLE